mgnify:CR=1 FL=1
MKKKILLYILISTIALILVGTSVFIYIYWPRTVELFDTKISSNTVVLDLTGCPINTSNEWITKLREFKKLEAVVCKDNTITIGERIKLEELYPNVYFDIIAIIDIYGLSVREDATELDLSVCTIDDISNIADSLKQFPELKNVNLSDQKLSQELQFKLIDEFPNISFVWDVEIAGKIANSNVTSLDLSNSKINDLDSFKTTLSLFPNLTYLDMSDCNLSYDVLASLREEFPNIKIVWTLRFGIWKTKTDAVAFSVLITTFNYTRMTSKDIEILKYCTDLQALDLGHQAITDVSFIADTFPELRILILADNKITDISPLAKLKHLHYLELFMNRVTDLSPLIACNELVDLNLCYNTTLSDISPLLNNDFPNLERLWISHCRISSTNYRALFAKYPNAKINAYGAGSTNDGWRTHERYYAMINMFYKRNYISELFTKYDT